MSKLLVETKAPTFALLDFNGKVIDLKDYSGKKNVLLVFNRGFL